MSSASVSGRLRAERKASDPVPTLNSFHRYIWERAAQEMGLVVTWKHSKTQIRTMIVRKNHDGYKLPNFKDFL